jgi:hypothetical protein
VWRFTEMRKFLKISLNLLTGWLRSYPDALLQLKLSRLFRLVNLYERHAMLNILFTPFGCLYGRPADSLISSAPFAIKNRLIVEYINTEVFL